MDLRSDLPFWLVKNGLLRCYPPLEADQDCDVAIIGGGITGALVAHQLCLAGMSVIVVDRREIAQGSTSASTALLQYEIDSHLIDLSRQFGEAAAVRSYQLCSDAIDRLADITSNLDDDCGFGRQASLYVASRSRDCKTLQAECELRARHGFDVRWCTPPEIQDEFGFEALGGILSAKGAVVDPFRLTHRLLEAGLKRNLRVYDRTTINEWKSTPDQVELTTDRGAVIRAKSMIFACGYEAQNYLREKIVTLKSTYALVTGSDQPQVWKQPAMIWESARPYLYLRRTPDGRILAGGEDDSFRSPLRRDASLARKEQRLIARLRTLFPDFKLDSEYAWAGTFGETKDGLAYIGPSPEIENAFFALGFGGNGVTFSVIAADILCDLVQGRPNEDANLFRFGR